MGLDVYLTRYEDREEFVRQEKQWEEEERKIEEAALLELGYTKGYEVFSNDPEIWGKEDHSGGLFAKERKFLIKPNEEFKSKYYELVGARKRAKIVELGHGIENPESDFPNPAYLSSVEDIREDVAKYPDHYFKVGYFRSSYNEGGINRVLKAAVNMDLETIFPEAKGKEYLFTPNWGRALENVKMVMQAYYEHLSGPAAGTYIFSVSLFRALNTTKPAWADEKTDPRLRIPNDTREALELYKYHAEKDKKDPHKSLEGEPAGYSNFFGHFHINAPMEVLAVIPGGKKAFLGPEVYIVAKNKDFKKPEDDWYYQALDIVKTTIEFVLAKPDPEKYYLRWSG